MQINITEFQQAHILFAGNFRRTQRRAIGRDWQRQMIEQTNGEILKVPKRE